MKIERSNLSWLTGAFLLLLLAQVSFSQSLTSGSANSTEQTAYPTFTPNDPIYYFCGNQGDQNGSLTASTASASVTFTWEKWNSVTRSFDFLATENGTSSIRNNLGDGCYRVTFTEGSNNYQFRAWVFNSWIEPVAQIANSDCNTFTLNGTATSAAYTYSDLTSGQPVALNSSLRYFWFEGTSPLGTVPNFNVSPPPSKNSSYKVEVTDRSGCMKSAEVIYQSIVPKAQFSWTANQKTDAQYAYPEAPAEIQFNDESENGDRDKYEWFIYKEKTAIEAESSGGAEVDSIRDVLYDTNPIYIYENSGKYKVKLVVAKESPGFVCRDTFYLADYIVVDTSLVKVAPVFTPNGDGINDQLIVKTRSLKSLDFQVFNRWGNLVHQFRRNDYVPEDAELAAWDGKVRGKLVSAGVYYWVVDAQGRDGERRRKKGFVQVIW